MHTELHVLDSIALKIFRVFKDRSGSSPRRAVRSARGRGRLQQEQSRGYLRAEVMGGGLYRSSSRSSSCLTLRHDASTPPLGEKETNTFKSSDGGFYCLNVSAWGESKADIHGCYVGFSSCRINIWVFLSAHSAGTLCRKSTVKSRAI